jgi:hypothetical protein
MTERGAEANSFRDDRTGDAEGREGSTFKARWKIFGINGACRLPVGDSGLARRLQPNARIRPAVEAADLMQMQLR